MEECYLYDLRRDLVIGVLCILIVLSTVTVLPTAKAPGTGTAVCGLITSDTTWTLANGPYWVECDVTVDDGVTLGVLSGVNVKFNGYYSIYVEGTFSVAVESVDPPAVFTSNESTPQVGDWRAIQFNSTSNDDNSGIANSVIEYSDYGIRLHEASPSSFQWDKIWYNNYGIYSYYSTPRILNSTIIWNEEDGIWADHLDPLDRDPPYTPWPGHKPVPIYVEGSNVSENGKNGVNIKDSSLNVSYSDVRDNTHSGVHVLRTGTSIYNGNLSSNDRHGMYVDTSTDVTVRDSVFHQNIWDGISMHDSDANEIVGSNFTSNYNAMYLGDSSWNSIHDNDMWMYWRGCAWPPFGGRPPGEQCGPGLVIDDASNNNSVYSNLITQTRGATNKGGVYVRDSYHNKVYSNDFRRNEIGVCIEGSFVTNVTENQFRDDKYGVVVGQIPPPIGTRSEKTNVSDNTFLDETYSIFLNHSFMTVIGSNDITSSSGRSGTGIYMMEASEWVDVRFNEITKKTIGIEAHAAKVGYSIYRNNISDNGRGIEVTGSVISNFVVAMVIWENVMWENDYGINVLLAKYLEIRNNSINASASAAIYLRFDSNVNISNNWIENNTEKGIWLNDSYARIYDYNDIANNNIGVYLEGTADADINYNNIFSNAAYGLKNWGSNTPDATWNWWGDSRGPYDDSDDGCCVLNTNTNGDRVLDDSSHAADYCGSGSDWLTAKI